MIGALFGVGLSVFGLLSGSLPDTGLMIRTMRVYRADPGGSPGKTDVTVFIGVPEALLTAGLKSEVSLQFTVRVMDSAGAVLHSQNYPRRTAIPLPRGEADRLEIFRFVLGAGRYQLEATVTDSVSKRRLSSTVTIEGFESPPAASDLLVSRSLRQVGETDTVPQPGEFRRGGLIVAISPEMTIGGPTASIGYLLETYFGALTDAQLVISVIDESGAERKRIGPSAMKVPAGIGLLTGQIEVGDLPAGLFRLRADVTFGGQKVTREATFEVDPAVGGSPAALSDADYFERLSGDMLDEAYAPLGAIATRQELTGWPAGGNDSQKRAFLAKFWKPRDPAPKTAANERRAKFYDGVRYVNAFYNDPNRKLEGWQTDRGRIFLREGLPGYQVLRREKKGTIPAYEIWQYYEPDPRFYVFADRGLLGYELIRTDDRRERGNSKWQAIMTPAGVRELVKFLGRVVLNSER